MVARARRYATLGGFTEANRITVVMKGSFVGCLFSYKKCGKEEET
jgi:hypothetical protein